MDDISGRGGHDHKTVRPHILILTVLIAATRLENQSECRRRGKKRYLKRNHWEQNCRQNSDCVLMQH